MHPVVGGGFNLLAVPSQTVAGHSGSDESRVLPLRSRVSYHRGSLEGDSNETRCPSSAPSQYPVLQRYRKEREVFPNGKQLETITEFDRVLPQSCLPNDPKKKVCCNV